jgi:hypothetical protein
MMFFFHFVCGLHVKCRLQAFAKSRDGDIGRWAEHTFAGGVATGAAFVREALEALGERRGWFFHRT